LCRTVLLLRPLRDVPTDCQEAVRESGELRWVNPLQDRSWDQLLQTHRGANVFHTAGWAEVLTETYGFAPFYLAQIRDECLQSLMGIMEVNSWLTRKRGISLPFTDQCPPLLSRSSPPFGGLFSRAVALGKERGWKSLEVRGISPDWGQESISFYEHSLNLLKSEESLFNGFSSSMRRAIRKAEAGEIRIESFDTIEAMESYYELHQLTRQKHGLPPQPFSFFKNILRSLIQKNNGRIFLAFNGTKAVAGAVFLYFAGKAIYKFGASDPRVLEGRPNNLSMWSAIKFLKAIGCEALSFGRTSIGQEGLRRFKLGFGTEERLVRYLKYDLKKENFIQQKDGSGGFPAIFRYCPRSVTRLAGSILYPHIA
jgi:hypothetical protein